MKKVIVGLGEILWDVFPNMEVLGGAPANFAYHAGKLGDESYIVSAIGRDELGTNTLNTLKQKGTSHLIERTDYPTGQVTVELSGEGIPAYIIRKDVAWDHIPFTQQTQELAARTDAVCFGTLAQRHKDSRQTIALFLQHMPVDSLKVFDINLRQNFYSKEIIEESLRMANVLKLNEDELTVIAQLFGLGGHSETALCKGLAELYQLDIVILTKGAEGSYIFAKEETSFLPTRRVVVADTVGAGDSFTAAFVAAHLQGYELEKAHYLAVEVSAYVCTQHGAMPHMPEEFRLKL